MERCSRLWKVMSSIGVRNVSVLYMYIAVYSPNIPYSTYTLSESQGRKGGNCPTLCGLPSN